MKYPGAVEELARIMKPGARLVLCEMWGANPLLNALRRMRAALAGEAEEQGERIILSPTELRALDPYFTGIEVETRNLLAMGKRLFRGHFQKRWVRSVVGALESVDRALLAVAPPLGTGAAKQSSRPGGEKNWQAQACPTWKRPDEGAILPPK